LPPDPLILAFDTSAAHCAAALLSGDEVLSAAFEPMAKGQAERLFGLLNQVLGEAGKDWPDLSAIAVGIGPGNFTGIRISVSAARGLALSLGVPAIGVTGFEALTVGLPRPVLASIDARRGQRFVQLIDRVGAHQPALLESGSWPTEMSVCGAHCVGDDADEAAEQVGGISTKPLYPLAVAIARVAAGRLDRPATRPAPLYIRAADAAPSSGPTLRILL